MGDVVLRFGLLGPLVVDDGVALRPVTGLKVRVLLAALLLAPNRVVSKDTLMDAMWGEHLPSSAGASFANHATRLRRILSPAGDDRLRTVPPGYQLLVAEGDLDIEVFEARARAAGLAHQAGDWPTVREESAAALALWRGAPLSDLPGFRDQRAPSLRVHQLDQLRLQVREWAFDAGLRLGHHREILDELGVLAAENPLREELHHQLMVALHRTGRQAEAYEVFHTLRRELVEELGTEPGATVRRTYEELLNGEDSPAPPGTPAPAVGDVAVAPRAPYQIPSSVPEFTGRDTEAAALVALLRRAASGPAREAGDAPDPLRPVVVSGMGGIGKTALAVQAARLVREEFPDGTLYADLRGFSSGGPRSAHDLLARLLDDLGARPAALPDDTDDRAALFRSAVAGRRVLLVLDNARDAAQVVPLLPPHGPSAVLVTSRHLLAELPGVELMPLHPLRPDEQLALLSRLCGSARIEREPAALTGILAACGGLPLALRIVGGRLTSRPSWPLELLAERLAPNPGRLRALAMGAVAVQDTFDMSYLAIRDSGNAPEQAAARTFRLLGVWKPHTFSVGSAAALLGVPEGDAAAALELLVDANLVHSPEPGRYALHDLLGEYAAERAAEEEPAPEREAAVVRMLTWYARAVVAASALASHETQSPPPLDGSASPDLPRFTEDAQAIEWTRNELPTIREAIGRAGRIGRSDIAWRLATGLFGYATTHWWTGEWDACLRQAMEIAVAHEDVLGRAWLHRRFAVAHGMASRNAECLEHLRAALGFFTEAGDTLAQASILGNMAAVHTQSGDGAQALVLAERSYELYRRSASDRSEALALNRIAEAHDLLGDHALAATYHRKVIRMLREQRHGVFLATSLTNLGVSLRKLGDREAALKAQTEALSIRREMRDPGGTADCLASMARTHLHFGDREAARARWEQCLELALRHNMTQHIEVTREGLAALS
ncbi:AfsR/SARP family transcriptional regulator [Streptomyces sp. NBC_01789]|uniref:AfsR/SARP family transcriptional regulator n=1 Tax=Streptomyces sp. NBC_01789 TaxID=2975941 RepID=UPI00225AC626|nr:AfsR/SARP family transcriptional regulator [Streptomyces sp. NBC_01789]MCX4451065.1 tetratricopeptide repeat protein [Streptomyces sp. NBC_01789]